MASRRHPRGLIDTSAVIDIERIAPEALPEELAVSTATMTELAAGPHATADPDERSRRQERLQRAEATFDPISLGVDGARATGAGSADRGAIAAELPLYTQNPSDFGELENLLEVVAIQVGKLSFNGLRSRRRGTIAQPMPAR